MSEIDEKELAELLNESAEFGKQHALAEDAGKEDERKKIRLQWLEFFKSHRGTPNEVAIRRAYWEGQELEDS